MVCGEQSPSIHQFIITTNPNMEQNFRRHIQPPFGFANFTFLDAQVTCRPPELHVSNQGIWCHLLDLGPFRRWICLPLNYWIARFFSKEWTHGRGGPRESRSKSLVLGVFLPLPLASTKCYFLKWIFIFYRCVLTFRALHRKFLQKNSWPTAALDSISDLQISNFHHDIAEHFWSLNSRIIKESDGLIRSRYLPFTIGPLYDLSPVEPKVEEDSLIEPQNRSSWSSKSRVGAYGTNSVPNRRD